VTRWVADGSLMGRDGVCDGEGGEEPSDVAWKHGVSKMPRAAGLGAFRIRGSELAGGPRSRRRDGAASQENVRLAAEYQKREVVSRLLLFWCRTGDIRR